VVSVLELQALSVSPEKPLATAAGLTSTCLAAASAGSVIGLRLKFRRVEGFFARKFTAAHSGSLCPWHPVIFAPPAALIPVLPGTNPGTGELGV
jgi:hypothetical protein